MSWTKWQQPSLRIGQLARKPSTSSGFGRWISFKGHPIMKGYTQREDYDDTFFFSIRITLAIVAQ